MPTAYIKKLHNEYGISIKSLEKAWEQAKLSSKDKENFAMITGIFKKIINNKYNLNEETVTDTDLFIRSLENTLKRT